MAALGGACDWSPSSEDDWLAEEPAPDEGRVWLDSELKVARQRMGPASLTAAWAVFRSISKCHLVLIGFVAGRKLTDWLGDHRLELQNTVVLAIRHGQADQEHAALRGSEP